MSEIAEDSSTSEEKIHKPNRERNVSGELDVFEAQARPLGHTNMRTGPVEATRYFSDFNEPTTIEYSRIQIDQKQSIVTEYRQKRVHPETEEQLPKPRVVVVVKPQEKKMTRGGGRKLTSFLNSLLRSAGLKKSKSESTSEVETPRGERMRRKSCVVTTHVEASSPILGVGAWSLNARRRSFDEKHVKVLMKSDQKLNISFCESLCADQRVECKYSNAGDVNNESGGCESDSSSESDLFELDLFAKSNP